MNIEENIRLSEGEKIAWTKVNKVGRMYNKLQRENEQLKKQLQRESDRLDKLLDLYNDYRFGYNRYSRNDIEEL